MRKRLLLLLPCILILSALALTACGSGGDDEGEVKEVIETSATSTDSADCTKLETQKFMEQIGQESGKDAVEACEEEAEKEEGAKSVSVSSIAIDGTSATAETALTGGGLDGQTLEVALIKDGDQWKLNEVVKFTEFDQEKLVETLEDEFSKSSGELSPKLAACFIEAFEEGSQAEVEELLLEGSARALEEVAEACANPSA